MGQALIRGLLDRNVLTPKNVWAAAKREKSCQAIRDSFGIEAFTDYKAALKDTDILLICVKPSGIHKVLETLKAAKISEKTLIISILAGTTLETIESGLGTKNPVIRAMPNTPCIVGQGMTVLGQGTYATDKDLEKATAIFSVVGEWLELDESHFDAVTSLCGSGPAYMYLIMEALADGGVRVGLPREVALKIVSQVVLGSAHMVKESGRHPAALRDDVTTPAGCTIAGLLMMEDGKIRSVLARAVEEATAVAGELGKK